MICAGYKGKPADGVRCHYRARENGYCGYHQGQASSSSHIPIPRLSSQSQIPIPRLSSQSQIPIPRLSSQAFTTFGEFVPFHPVEESVSPSKPLETSSLEKCCICLSKVKEGTDAELKCKHAMHLDCVKSLRDDRCPLCRQTLSSSLLEDKDVDAMKERSDQDRRERESLRLPLGFMLAMMRYGGQYESEVRAILRGVGVDM